MGRKLRNNKIHPINGNSNKPQNIQPNKKSALKQVGNDIISGFAFGSGSAIAHNTVNRIFASNESKVEPSIDSEEQRNNRTNNTLTCQVLMKEYEKCSKDYTDCKDILDKMIDLKC